MNWPSIYGGGKNQLKGCYENNYTVIAKSCTGFSNSFQCMRTAMSEGIIHSGKNQSLIVPYQNNPTCTRWSCKYLELILKKKLYINQFLRRLFQIKIF